MRTDPVGPGLFERDEYKFGIVNRSFMGIKCPGA